MAQAAVRYCSPELEAALCSGRRQQERIEQDSGTQKCVCGHQCIFLWCQAAWHGPYLLRDFHFSNIVIQCHLCNLLRGKGSYSMGHSLIRGILRQKEQALGIVCHHYAVCLQKSRHLLEIMLQPLHFSLQEIQSSFRHLKILSFKFGVRERLSAP